MYLAIEIGGTKLQLALGRGLGEIDPAHIVRETVVPEDGGDGIRRQIETAIPVLLSRSKISRSDLIACGVGFGGPTDDATESVIKSHHIAGWDGFPLAEWIGTLTGLPTTICNDADVAGLAEAVHGAGKGKSPIFYITVGSGIGGGLIIDEHIYRGVGKGAAEVGHVRPAFPLLDRPHAEILEHYASGWGIGRRGSEMAGRTMTGAEVAISNDPAMLRIFDDAMQALAEGICTVIKLLCPARIVIGGGVSLSDPNRFFVPLRRYVADRGMAAFAGLTEIVPAALGETVVLHGAIELAKRKFTPRADQSPANHVSV
jgi:glucokinase